LDEDLKIIDSAICRQIHQRQPQGVVDLNDSLRVNVKKLYCWTKVSNPGPETTITHVWYWGKTERARVSLHVGPSKGWRTWSSKIIQPHEKGGWHVYVLDEIGQLLKSLTFWLGQRLENQEMES